MILIANSSRRLWYSVLSTTTAVLLLAACGDVQQPEPASDEPPQLGIVSPFEGQVVGQPAVIEVRASSTNTVSSLRLDVDGEQLDLPPRAHVIIALALPDGFRTAEVVATDDQGLQTTRTRSFLVDSSLGSDEPVFIIDTPQDEEVVGPGAGQDVVAITVGLTGTLHGALDKVESVEVYLNGVLAGAAKRIGDPDSPDEADVAFIYEWDTEDPQVAPDGHDPTKSGDRVITARVTAGGTVYLTPGVMVEYQPEDEEEEEEEEEGEE